MPTWGEILIELQQSAAQNNGQSDFDGIRRKYLRQLHELTGRDTILYSTNWMSGGAPGTSIVLEDMQGMMEVNKGLKGPNLDVILHSPGGSAEDTAAIVRYLRSKYSHIRAFIPIAAMSAATMWALGCDEIVMGKHSQLGPIDPQLVSPQGQFPARAIVEQFERAKRECAADPSQLSAWLPILQQYGPSLIEQCEKADALAQRLVKEWLAACMFKKLTNGDERAAEVAAWFADYGIHQSHSLGISRDQAKAQGLAIVDLEADQALQDAVLSAHHASVHTFATGAVKIVENHLGKAFVRVQQIAQFPVQVMQQQQMVPQPAGPLNI